MRAACAISSLLATFATFYVLAKAHDTGAQFTRRGVYVQCSSFQQRVLKDALTILINILWVGLEATRPGGRDQYIRQRLSYHFKVPGSFDTTYLRYRIADIYWESYTTLNPGEHANLAHVPIHCIDTDGRCHTDGTMPAYVGRNKKYIVLVRSNLLLATISSSIPRAHQLILSSNLTTPYSNSVTPSSGYRIIM